ncbi:hypothetical protein MTO96_049152 [Rhipicephalus appendiculatus]
MENELRATEKTLNSTTSNRTYQEAYGARLRRNRKTQGAAQEQKKGKDDWDNAQQLEYKQNSDINQLQHSPTARNTKKWVSIFIPDCPELLETILRTTIWESKLKRLPKNAVKTVVHQQPKL